MNMYWSISEIKALIKEKTPNKAIFTLSIDFEFRNGKCYHF